MRLRSAHACGTDWARALDLCLAQLDPLPTGANLGFLYLGDPLGEMADAVLAGLRRATGIEAWVGAAGEAVLAERRHLPAPGGMAVLLGAFPERSFRLFEGNVPSAGPRGTVAIVHADPRVRGLPERLRGLARDSEAFLVGGIVSSRVEPVQIAGGITAGDISGVIFGADVAILPLLNRGCTALGPPCRVTSRIGREIRGLDGQAALAVVKARAGDLMSRDPRRLMEQLWLGEPTPSGEARAVGRIAGVDEARGTIALDADDLTGDRILVLRRDGAEAERQLRADAAELQRRLGERETRGLLYFTSGTRARGLFGRHVEEVGIARAAAGSPPLVGMVTDAEIFQDRLERFAAAAVAIA